MFTSRAEHRLVLRHDTADSRLTPKGRDLGLVNEARWERFLKKTQNLEEIRELLRNRKTPGTAEEESLGVPSSLRPHAGEALERALADSRVRVEDVLPFAPELAAWPAEWLERAVLDIKYAGYIEKERRVIARAARMDAIKLDPNLDYGAIGGLSAESREKLKAVRPLTVGQAARIPGVRQGDIALLMVLVKKG
jgi:tRNA uridine 5-carboxymethylaminomethyl modification enzyme